jgi:hypothetical protein|tara:strand:- start:2342 stop:2824 length:483 start_codon:yes stop_codon:yes gene_type:complete
MGTTTFSGPIKAGTIKETTGTTVGSDIKNTGQVVMAQSFTTGSLAAGASAANVTDVVIPAKSQIIDIVLDVATAITNAAAVLSIGDTVGGNATLINQFTCATGAGNAGRKYPGSEAGAALSWAETSNTADIRLTWTTTGATQAGEIRATVLYQQASNLVA